MKSAFLLFYAILLIVQYGMSQKSDHFTIKDTICEKEAYIVIKTDSLGKRESLFLRFENYSPDSSYIYLDSRRLVTHIIYTKKYDFINTYVDDSNFEKKEVIYKDSNIAVYKITSLFGFVVWEVDAETFNKKMISINEKKYQSSNGFVKILSPLTKDIQIIDR